ncbi:MAG: hypothetical protein WCI74_18190 [Actinomycetes bacterium]
MAGRSTALAIAAIVGVTLVLVGCTRAGTLPVASGATALQQASPAEADDCGSANIHAELAPYTIAGLASEGKTFVVAGVTEVETSIFNTADGSKPPGFFARPGNTANARSKGQILTPLQLQAQSLTAAPGDPHGIRVAILGGTIGCYTVHVDVAPTVEIGKRYVFILTDDFDADGNKLPDLPLARFAWPVDANDMVSTPEGALSLSDLTLAVEKAIAG